MHQFHLLVLQPILPLPQFRLHHHLHLIYQLSLHVHDIDNRLLLDLVILDVHLLQMMGMNLLHSLLIPLSMYPYPLLYLTMEPLHLLLVPPLHLLMMPAIHLWVLALHLHLLALTLRHLLLLSLKHHHLQELALDAFMDEDIQDLERIT